jgi:hypothetical protein
MDTHIKKYDNVNNPKHYNKHGIECIDAIQASMSDKEFLGYLKANVLKYMWRYDYKGKPLEDLQKAQWYLDKLINLIHNSELNRKQLIMNGFKEGANDSI